MSTVFRLSSGLRSALLVGIFAPVLATCDKQPAVTQPEAVSVSGVWVGTVGDSTLRLELTEWTSDSVSGVAIHTLRSMPETLMVTQGVHIQPDSLFLDAPCISVPRCIRQFHGHLEGRDSATGVFEVFVGHDPPISRTWGVARVP
jgi:hypothetical protein